MYDDFRDGLSALVVNHVELRGVDAFALVLVFHGEFVHRRAAVSELPVFVGDRPIGIVGRGYELEFRLNRSSLRSHTTCRDDRRFVRHHLYMHRYDYLRPQDVIAVDDNQAVERVPVGVESKIDSRLNIDASARRNRPALSADGEP